MTQAEAESEGALRGMAGPTVSISRHRWMSQNVRRSAGAVLVWRRRHRMMRCQRALARAPGTLFDGHPWARGGGKRGGLSVLGVVWGPLVKDLAVAPARCACAGWLTVVERERERRGGEGTNVI